MNEMEKYLDAIEAAIDANNPVVIALLDSFATHVYQDLYAKAGNSSGEEQLAWEALYLRAQQLIARMARAGMELW